jgi:pimeloyl-ACP methyl ester carboxylesterase
VQKAIRISSMILVGLVMALAVLALITLAGIVALDRLYPRQGRLVEVAGGQLNVVDIGPRGGVPIVMIHGASSNLETMRHPLGDLLARGHRVILIDRPGHGWSTRERLTDSTPAIQGRMIAEALQRLDVSRAIVVAHSWAGALGLRLALDYPQRVAGLVMLAPVAYSWRGGVGRYNKIVTTPVIGPLLAYTITLPLGLLLTAPGTRGVFLPQTMPDDYIQSAMVRLLLRPREFLSNAWDLVTLKASVIEQSPRYATIKVSAVIIAGDADATVWTDVHARPLAKVIPHAKLIVLPGVGHMVQNAAPDLVVREIEAMSSTLDATPKAVLN